MARLPDQGRPDASYTEVMPLDMLHCCAASSLKKIMLRQTGASDVTIGSVVNSSCPQRDEIRHEDGGQAMKCTV